MRILVIMFTSFVKAYFMCYILVKDIKLLAGDSVNVHVMAYDPDGELIKLTALGAPFMDSIPASFTTDALPYTNDIVNGTFSWKPLCSNVSVQPYLIEFRAQDLNPL